MTARRDPTSGVTLVEMVVALAIFALIGGAGYSMLDQVLRTDARTSGRLDRLGDLQRALFLIGQDFAQADPHSVTAEGGSVAFARDGTPIRYALEGTTLRRELGQGRGAQTLVSDVQALHWRSLAAQGGWTAGLPAPPGAGRPRNPRAVEVVLVLPGGQAVRQVSVLPVEAD